jgi:hypothetical protein
MATALKKFGADLVFTIDSAGSATASTEVDISAWVMSVDGLPGDREMADVTCGGGAKAHQWLVGMKAADISLECLFDQTDGSAYDVFCSTDYGYHLDTASRTFSYGPAGNTAGYPKFTGECKVKSVTVPAKPLEPITFSVSLVLDSTLSVGVWT